MESQVAITQPLGAMANGLMGRLMFWAQNWAQRHKGKMLSPATFTALERKGVLYDAQPQAHTVKGHTC